MINLQFIPNFFLSIFFPKRCVLCGEEGNFVCFKCAGLIEIVRTSTCPMCGKINRFGQYCPPCKKKSGSSLSGLIIATRYDAGPTKEMIHHLKYSGFTELSESLAELIFFRLRDRLPNDPLVIVPVPLHKKREAQRGFNQAELIARILSKKLNIPGGCSLTRIKNTETQVKLDKESRIKNLVGAFVCSDVEFIENKNVILIDDVATSLATLNECAKILKEAGAKNVYGAVVARRI